MKLASPRARRTDPATSHNAARRKDGKPQLSECRLILAVLRGSRHPMTYREIHAKVRGKIREAVEVMRRLDDLRKARAVRGKAGAARRCKVSGNVAQVWVAR